MVNSEITYIPGKPRRDIEVWARYVAIANLVDGKRILDIQGDFTSVMQMAEAGAAELTVTCETPESLKAELIEAEAEGIEVLEVSAPPWQFETAAFDLILFHDLANFLATDDIWVTELRRVLDPNGYLVLAIPNPAGQRLSNLFGEEVLSPLSYEEVFAKLSPTFGQLTLLGQSPVVANLFYDFQSEEEDPSLVFDRSLLSDDADQAGWFILIFGPETVRRDDLVIVQNPWQPLVEAVEQRRTVVQAPAAAEAVPQTAEVSEVTEAVVTVEAVESLQALEQEKQAMQAQLQMVEAQVATFLLEKDALLADIKRQEDESQALTAQYQQGLEEFQHCNEQLVAKDAELTQAIESLQACETQLNTLQTGYQQKETELNHLRTDYQQTESDIQQRFDQSMQERDAALETSRALESTLEQFKQQYLVHEQKITDFEQAQVVWRRNEEEAKSLASERDALRSQVETLEKSLTGLRHDQQGNSQELSHLNQQLEELRLIIDQKQNAIESLEQTHQQLTKDLETSREEQDSTVASLKAELSTHIDSLKAAKERLAQTEQMIMALEEEKSKFNRDRNSFEEQIQDLMKEVAQLQKSAQEGQQEATELKTIIEERNFLRTSIERERSRSTQLEQESTRLRSAVGQLEADRAALVQEVKRLSEAMVNSQRMDIATAMVPPTGNDGAPAVETNDGLGASRDAVGRPIESSLEDIEDLIASSVPVPRAKG